MSTRLRYRAAPLCLLMLVLAHPGIAQSVQRDQEKEQAILQQLEMVAPRSVETFKAATEALDKENYDQAARLYEEVLKKAPEFDPAIRRLGAALFELGQVDKGISLMEMAVHKKRSPENLIYLAQALSYPNRGGTTEDKRRALALAKEATAKDKAGDLNDLVLIARLAWELDEEQDLRDAASRVKQLDPDSVVSHYLSALVAVTDEEWATAEDEIRKAQSLGLPAEVAEQFLATGVQTRATVWRYVYYSLSLCAAWAGGLVLLFVSGNILSRKTLNWVETTDPNTPASGGHMTIRKYYRWLINAAGSYYYISLPVVIFLIIAVAGSIIYGFFMAGIIPSEIVAPLVIGALVTVFVMIRSLFTRREVEDPGRPLKEDEAPGLWALAREVAASVGTRPVDEIRVTPGTDMAVYERGSFKERTHDSARRILILGVGTLNGFSQGAFRSVLAHEYGHFLHRDTAGGDVAIRVSNDMTQFALAMIKSNQAVPWNIAFVFLRVYHFIFRRISHGAARLQEVMADWIAVRNYGAQAFEEGLAHVIRRGVEFEDITFCEIIDATNARRSIQNLYELKANREVIIEEQVKEVINRATTEDDTHPCPSERFRLARRIESEGRAPASGMVWDLIANRAALTAEMNSIIEKQAKAMSSG